MISILAGRVPLGVGAIVTISPTLYPVPASFKVTEVIIPLFTVAIFNFNPVPEPPEVVFTVPAVYPPSLDIILKVVGTAGISSIFKSATTFKLFSSEDLYINCISFTF